jgi:hypothetical protein
MIAALGAVQFPTIFVGIMVTPTTVASSAAVLVPIVNLPRIKAPTFAVVDDNGSGLVSTTTGVSSVDVWREWLL